MIYVVLLSLALGLVCLGRYFELKRRSHPQVLLARLRNSNPRQFAFVKESDLEEAAAKGLGLRESVFFCLNNHFDRGVCAVAFVGIGPVAKMIDSYLSDAYYCADKTASSAIKALCYTEDLLVPYLQNPWHSIARALTYEEWVRFHETMFTEWEHDSLYQEVLDQWQQYLQSFLVNERKWKEESLPWKPDDNGTVPSCDGSPATRTGGGGVEFTLTFGRKRAPVANR